MLRLREIHIHRGYFDPDCKQPLVGKVVFVSPNGEVSIKLNEEQAQRVLAVVADGIVETSREIATTLTAEVIDQGRQAIEHKAPAPSIAEPMPF